MSGHFGIATRKGGCTLSLTLDEAKKVIEGGIKKAQALGIRISIAVVDEAGNLVAHNRMDGAWGLGANLCVDEAWMAATFRTDGTNLKQWAAQPWFQSVILQSRGRIIPAEGAVPIMRGGQCVGGVGVAGGSEAQDKECCLAGIAAIS